MDGGEGAEAGRGWLIALVVWALAVLVAGASSEEASAQAAGTPQPTATPTFQWVVSDQTDGRLRIHVDPFQRRFQWDGLNDLGTPEAGTPISVPSMQTRSRRITFQWSSLNRPCPTATPVAVGAGPKATPTPGRCPMFVWATLDRSKQQVRATMFRRTTNGHTVMQVLNRPTPLALPKAPDPSVVIDNFSLSPKRRIIRATDQLYFQNNTTLPCTIQFSSTRPPGKAPADPTDFDLGVVPPGQVARAFPRLLPTPSPTPGPIVASPTPKPDLWQSGEHLYTGSCGDIQLAGSIVVP